MGPILEICVIANSKIRLQNFIFLIFLISLTSCKNEREDVGNIDTIDSSIQWTLMDDHSQYYVFQSEYSIRIERCWPISAGYDCLIASSQNGSSRWSAERQKKSKLSPTDISYRGYSCSVDSNQPFGIEYQEEISRAIDRVVLSNMSTSREPIEKGWARNFVEDFLNDNGLNDASGWFSCPAFRSMVLSGSGETLTSTTVTREDLFEVL